jgi:predicted alpha-1,2-mannosidase
VRQFTDFYCLWDSVRNVHSFYNLFFPDTSASIVNALLDVAEHEQWLPDAHIAGRSAYQQSACSADIIFAEAAAKGIEGINYEKALKWTRKNAEVAPPDVRTAGRYLKDYEKLGYLSTDVTFYSVSRHLEYTYNDWCISRLARSLHDKKTERAFLERARRLWNLWSSKSKAFIPRDPSGKFLTGANPWELQHPYFYEGTGIVWALNALHDIAGLVKRMGGQNRFVEHLNRIFKEGLFHVKETRMHIPHLYTYASRPDLASERVHASLKTSFKNSPDGLLDNEDMGCQSAYYLFNAMGIYPIYGQTRMASR